MFWDSSALLPYLGPEPSSEASTSLLERDGSPSIWWATPVECVSALERRRREGALDRKLYNEARSRLSRIIDEVAIVQPHSTLRLRAERLLATHPLRAADALQLAAALVSCDDKPQGQSFACLDARLRQAAEKEGFGCLPGRLPGISLAYNESDPGIAARGAPRAGPRRDRRNPPHRRAPRGPP